MSGKITRWYSDVKTMFRSKRLSWDEIYISPQYADIYAAMAAVFGLEYTFFHNGVVTSAFQWLSPYYVPVGIVLLFASVGIGARRLVPDLWHRLGWYILGWYWLAWGIGILFSSPQYVMSVGIIFLASVCWNNSNMDYRRPFAMLREELIDELRTIAREIGA